MLIGFTGLRADSNPACWDQCGGTNDTVRRLYRKLKSPIAPSPPLLPSHRPMQAAVLLTRVVEIDPRRTREVWIGSELKRLPQC